MTASVDTQDRGEPTIWDSLFPPAHQRRKLLPGCPAAFRNGLAIARDLGHDGLALERTVLAERRNVMRGFAPSWRDRAPAWRSSGPA